MIRHTTLLSVRRREARSVPGFSMDQLFPGIWKHPLSITSLLSHPIKIPTSAASPILEVTSPNLGGDQQNRSEIVCHHYFTFVIFKLLACMHRVCVHKLFVYAYTHETRALHEANGSVSNQQSSMTFLALWSVRNWSENEYVYTHSKASNIPVYISLQCCALPPYLQCKYSNYGIFEASYLQVRNMCWSKRWKCELSLARCYSQSTTELLFLPEYPLSNDCPVHTFLVADE